MNIITRLTSMMVAVLIATTAISVSANAADTKILVDMWDAGADMTMVDTMRIVNHPDQSKAPMGLTLAKNNVAAGKVTFVAINSSKNIEHEMVVAKLDDPAKGLAYLTDKGKVDEDAPGMNLGEIHELKPGMTGALTLDLSPGTYVLYCNIPGHYASGMWTILTVRAAAQS